MKKKILALLVTLATVLLLVFSSPISAKRGDESFNLQVNHEWLDGDGYYCHCGYSHWYKHHHYWYFFQWYKFIYGYMYHHGHGHWYRYIFH
ncbi:MAG: hypothetical protein JW762_13060 [Dehalococcoidales bacterium]|nr:hypothetical protein [Dehalococcoidales bacterium]